MNLAHFQIRDLLAVDVPIAVIQLAVLWLLADFGLLSATTALLAIAAASGVAVVWLVRERAQFRFDRARSAVHWSHNQRFGRWLLIVSLMWLVGDSSYRWLVAWLHGTESLGQFSAAQNIVLVLNPLVLTVTNLTQALSVNWFADGGITALREKVGRCTLLLAIWSGAACCLAALGGPLVNFIFGDGYAGLGPVVATLCLGMFARIVAMPIDGAMIALQAALDGGRGGSAACDDCRRRALDLLAGIGRCWLCDGHKRCSPGAIVQWWPMLQGGDDARN